jgi:hypothetical protein
MGGLDLKSKTPYIYIINQITINKMATIQFIVERTTEHRISFTLPQNELNKLQQRLIEKGITEQAEYNNDEVVETLIEMGYYNPDHDLQEAELYDDYTFYRGRDLQEVILPCNEFNEYEYHNEAPDLYWFDYENSKLIYRPYTKVWNDNLTGYFYDRLVAASLEKLGYNTELVWSQIAEDYIKTEGVLIRLEKLLQTGCISKREYNKGVKETKDQLELLRQKL